MYNYFYSARMLNGCTVFNENTGVSCIITESKCIYSDLIISVKRNLTKRHIYYTVHGFH